MRAAVIPARAGYARPHAVRPRVRIMTRVVRKGQTLLQQSRAKFSGTEPNADSGGPTDDRPDPREIRPGRNLERRMG